MLLRVKLEHRRHEAERKQKQARAAYVPPRGPATRLSPMQQTDVPRFLKECKQVKEQLQTQRWDEAVRLKGLVRYVRGGARNRSSRCCAVLCCTVL